MVGKLNSNMDIQQIIMTMADGNSDAEEVVLSMLRNKDLHLGVITCDKYGIRGDKLIRFFFDCCDGRVEKAAKTIDMFKYNVYSFEEVENNLLQPIPEDFLDESIVSVHIPLYSEEFIPGHPDWDEFAYLQKRNLNLKLKRKEAREKIPEWVVQGQTMMYPEKYAKWESCVIEKATGLSNGLILKNALEIMGILENGSSVDEAKRTFLTQNNLNGYDSDVRDIVLKFSNRGPEFYLATLPMDLSVEQKYKVDEVIKENVLLAKKHL